VAGREPRKDTRGILNAPAGLARFRLRRRAAAPALEPFVELYWLIDWDLSEPYEQHVVSHPAVNLVFSSPRPSEVAGVDLGLFSVKLEGVGRVVGTQFRPGGFRPFLGRPVSTITDLHVPVAEIFGAAGERAARDVLASRDDDEAVALVDAFLCGRRPERDEAAEEAGAVVEMIRNDPGLLRVGDVARRHGVSVRRLQRLFHEHVGVSPKWVIRRYRIHEAAERVARGRAVHWADLAAELGYADQAHLVRDFTAAVGMSPAAYARDALS
jgi:AraC-like DNA-binding protein